MIAEQHIAGQLFLDESRIRRVIVEGTDDVIAIWPRVEARLVLVVTVRLAVMDDVQPVASPTLAVKGRSQEAIDQQLVTVSSSVGDEGSDLLRLGREAG